MSDVAISQDHAIATYFSGPAVAGAAVNGNKLTNGGIVPDLDGRFLTIKLKILRISRYYSSREDSTVFPDTGAFHNRHITANPGSSSNLYIFMDHGERIDLDVGCEFGVRVNRR